MKPHSSHPAADRRRGLALVIVISALALISVLVVAIFSLTRREFKATQGYVSGKNAKQLGDVAVAVVQAQLQNGQATSTTGTTHATQPGMVRVYNSDGTFSAAHKLYSSGIMSVVNGSEQDLYGPQHIAPANWNTLRARYTDINEPVIRPALAAGAGQAGAGYAIYFPVIDPRAAYNYYGSGSGEQGTPGTSEVEGFSYKQSTSASGNGNEVSYNTVVLPNGGNPNALRLPMPLEWIYVLKDGTMGALNDGNVFITPAGANQPSADNPIVGRIAFWADDESCKINVNTAGEPTFSSTPWFYHQRDSKWAHFPGATGEYQRYPGHPATVALSAVFAPYYLMDPYYVNRPENGGLSRTDMVNLKNQLYDLLPKISSGGSDAGTRPFVTDDFSNSGLRDTQPEGAAANTINLTDALNERLYASVDEMLFTDNGYGANGRKPAFFNLPGGSTGQRLFGHDVLERSRFFLTAHSRSPEFTIHGLPRVCIWPVADESLGSGAANMYRTSADNMIALTATIRRATTSGGAGSYFFRRARSYSTTHDLGGSGTLSRNDDLLNYLVNQMSSLEWPATSPTSNMSNTSFQAKPTSTTA
jgi:uncharacterized protein (TIGR02600 family)